MLHTPSHSIVPVIRQSGRFVEAPTDLSIEGWLEISSALESYIQRNYKPIEDEVEVNGHLYFSTIYVPMSGADFSFVLTDEDRIPIGIQVPLPDANNIADYAVKLQEQLTKTEGIFPDQVVDVRTHFIRPTFKDLQPDASAKNVVSWDGFLKRSRTVVLGAPGSGKTTCLRRMAVELLDSDRLDEKPASIPIYIQMRDYVDSTLDINSIKRWLTSQHSASLSDDFVPLSNSGQFLLLFDGLDEVADDQRERLIESIRQIANLFPRNRIVISTRKAAYAWEFPDFNHLEIEPLSVAGIKEWSCQTLHRKKSWKLFFTYLNESEELLEIVRNPLLLSLTTSMFLRQSVTPHNRTTLLKHFVKALVEDWDSSRNIVRFRSRWTAPHRLYPILCYLSFECSKTGKSSFSIDDVLKWRKDYSDEAPVTQLLTVLAETTGLILQTSANQWSFSHKIYLDYLAAQFLVGSTLNASDLLKQSPLNESSKNVWSLASAITYDANHLFELIRKNKRMLELRKALLIVQALSDDLEIDKNHLKRSCEFVIKTIELLTKDLKVNVGSSNSLSLWSASFEDPKITVLQSEKGHQLRELLRLLYKVRSGPAKTVVSERLAASKIEAVNALAPILDVEGEYGDDLTTLKGKFVLLISIREPMPNMNESAS